MQTNPRLWDLVYNGILHSLHTREVQTTPEAQARVIDLADTTGLTRQVQEILADPTNQADTTAGRGDRRTVPRWYFTAARTIAAMIAVLTVSLSVAGVFIVVIVIPYAMLVGWVVTVTAESLPWIPDLDAFLGAAAVLPALFLIVGLVHLQGRILGPVIRRIRKGANPALRRPRTPRCRTRRNRRLRS